MAWGEWLVDRPSKNLSSPSRSQPPSPLLSSSPLSQRSQHFFLVGSKNYSADTSVWCAFFHFFFRPAYFDMEEGDYDCPAKVDDLRQYCLRSLFCAVFWDHFPVFHCLLLVSREVLQCNIVTGSAYSRQCEARMLLLWSAIALQIATEILLAHLLTCLITQLPICPVAHPGNKLFSVNDWAMRVICIAIILTILDFLHCDLCAL